jgi:hypothetical protein
VSNSTGISISIFVEDCPADLVGNCTFNDIYILELVQLQVTAKVGDVAGQGFERHDSTVTTHKSRAKQRVVACVSTDIKYDGVQPNRVAVLKLFWVLVHPHPAGMMPRTDNPFGAPQWTA